MEIISRQVHAQLIMFGWQYSRNENIIRYNKIARPIDEFILKLTNEEKYSITVPLGHSKYSYNTFFPANFPSKIMSDYLLKHLLEYESKN
jgi:hypothetical protein